MSWNFIASNIRADGLAGRAQLRLKAQIAMVDRCLLVLSKHLPKEEANRFITRESRAGLIKLVQLHPQEARMLFANLRDGLRARKLIFPAELLNTQNNLALKGFCRKPGGISEITRDGVLDFRRIGLKKKYPSVDRTPKINSYSFSNEVENIVKNLEKLAKDEEIGYLLLFSAVSKGLVELYVWGEKEYLSSTEEDKSFCEAKKRDIAANVKKLYAGFPFFENEFGRQFKRLLAEAEAKMTLSFNGGREKIQEFAARAILVSLRNRLDRRLIDMEEDRFTREKNNLESQDREIQKSIGRKIRMHVSGDWAVSGRTYRKGETPVLHQEIRSAMVGTIRLLSRINHQLEGIAAELKENEKMQDWIKLAHKDHLDNRDRLYDLGETLVRVHDRAKKRAQIAIVTVLTLLPLGNREKTEDLALSILNTTLGDFSRRRKKLLIIQEKLSALRVSVEAHLKKRWSPVLVGRSAIAICGAIQKSPLTR